MDKRKVRVSFELPVELREAAKAKALAEDVSVSQVIRWYLRAWVNGEVGTLLPEPEKIEP